ncbi:MAG: hypothetical protein M3305_05790 [Actinomycetota bacterium]|nr:hypothetical protein [Actinomycetota bacterium]
MGLRRWIKRLEHDAEEDMIEIPLQGSGVARFPESALPEAYLRNMDILRAKIGGASPPEPHPLQIALRNAAQYEKWHDSYTDGLEEFGPVEDLSE